MTPKDGKIESDVLRRNQKELVICHTVICKGYCVDHSFYNEAFFLTSDPFKEKFRIEKSKDKFKSQDNPRELRIIT